MSTLLILSYNEASTIKNVLENYSDHFEYLIVLDDKSTDNTSELINSLDNEKIIYHQNKKNMGAGKSFEIGLKIFNQLDSMHLIKIDGDDQFSKKDVLRMLDIGKKEDFDFIKCDRFWEGGIVGTIPFIRYFGNALASFLIKLSTGNWKLNDPLNGLFFISKKISKNFVLKKLFNKYGYPFFLVSYVINLSKLEQLKIGQYPNTVTYANEKSELKAGTMFFKLLYFTIYSYYSKIKIKIKFSNLQFSALVDIISQIFLILTFGAFYRLISIRYFSAIGPQGSWFIVGVIFFIVFLLLVIVSQNIENKVNTNKLYVIKSE